MGVQNQGPHRTDHKPLSYLDSLFARRNPSLTRWNIFLQALDIVTTEPRRGHGCKYFLSCIFNISILNIQVSYLEYTR